MCFISGTLAAGGPPAGALKTQRRMATEVSVTLLGNDGPNAALETPTLPLAFDVRAAVQGGRNIHH